MKNLTCQRWRDIIASAVVLAFLYGAVYAGYDYLRGQPDELYHFVPPGYSSKEVFSRVSTLEFINLPVPYVRITLKRSICADAELLRGIKETARKSKAILKINIEGSTCPDTK